MTKPDYTWCWNCKPPVMFGDTKKYQEHALEKHRDIFYPPKKKKRK